MEENEQELHNEKLYDLYPSPSILRETDTTMQHGWGHEIHKNFKRTNKHGRNRHRWKANIKTELNNITTWRNGHIDKFFSFSNNRKLMCAKTGCETQFT
jgi:hypothetical protein